MGEELETTITDMEVPIGYPVSVNVIVVNLCAIELPIPVPTTVSMVQVYMGRSHDGWHSIPYYSSLLVSGITQVLGSFKFHVPRTLARYVPSVPPTFHMKKVGLSLRIGQIGTEGRREPIPLSTLKLHMVNHEWQ